MSLVLQGSDLIRQETAERVREAARKLGYVYKRRAGELRGRTSKAIGVVINDLMNPFDADSMICGKAAGGGRRVMAVMDIYA